MSRDWELVAYDTALIGTSFGFGYGALQRGHDGTALFVTAALASVAFRAHRAHACVMQYRCNEPTGWHDAPPGVGRTLFYVDLACALVALYVSLTRHDTGRLRANVRRAAAFFATAWLVRLIGEWHALHATVPHATRRQFIRASQCLHALGHVHVLHGAWCAPARFKTTGARSDARDRRRPAA